MREQNFPIYTSENNSTSLALKKILNIFATKTPKTCHDEINPKHSSNTVMDVNGFHIQATESLLQSRNRAHKGGKVNRQQLPIKI